MLRKGRQCRLAHDGLLLGRWLGAAGQGPRTASRTPPQRSWCRTLLFSKSMGWFLELGLMQRM